VTCEFSTYFMTLDIATGVFASFGAVSSGWIACTLIGKAWRSAVDHRAAVLVSQRLAQKPEAGRSRGPACGEGEARPQAHPDGNHGDNNR
jgi:hypothetical protein